MRILDGSYQNGVYTLYIDLDDFVAYFHRNIPFVFPSSSTQDGADKMSKAPYTDVANIPYVETVYETELSTVRRCNKLTLCRADLSQLTQITSTTTLFEATITLTETALCESAAVPELSAHS